MTEATPEAEASVAVSADGALAEEAGASVASALPSWLADASREGALAGIVRIELPEGALPWRDAADEQVLRRRAQYTAGVEYIARNYGALEPLAWDGDALTLIFGGIPAAELPSHTYKASKDLWNRVRAELDLPVTLAAHVGRVHAGGEAGLVKGDDVEVCRKLILDVPRGGIALSEELALALPEGQGRESEIVGKRAGEERATHVFPRSAAEQAALGLVIDESTRLWERFRNYALSPDVRLVRYVGFRLQRKEPPRLDIREVFVPSEVELRRRSIEAELRKEKLLAQALLPLPWSARSMAEPEGTARNLGELWARSRSVLVLGDPGSGKTTLLRWLAVIAGSGSFALDAALGVAERLLPVPVSVGRLAEVRRGLAGNAMSVPAALARYFYDRSVYEEEVKLRDFLARELESGRCLVLLDGLDEVKSDERQALYQWLESFAAEYPQNRFVVSSRVVGYSGFQLPGDAVEAVLRPFDEAQVERYVRAFHRAYVRWETGAEPTTEDEAERLLVALRASPRLSALARNPFMLSALALIHRAEGKLPRHRVQAYEVFARALCETWAEARRLVAGEMRQPIIEYEEEALPILGELALAMHEQHPTGVAPKAFVIATLAAALEHLKGVSGAAAQKAAKEFLRRAGDEVQILLERGAEAWGFLHLTFQEFFVAAGLHAAERFEEVAVQHLFDPRWEEVIRLGVGYLALVQKRPTAAQKFVKRVLEHEEPEPRGWFTRVLRKQVPLAALLAAEAGDALPVELQERIAGMMADWLRVMPRELAVPVLKDLALTDFAPRVAAACKPLMSHERAETRARIASALGDLRSGGVEEALVAALSDEDAKVRDAAAKAIHPFLTKGLLRKIEPHLSDPRAEVRAAALDAVAPLGAELSEATVERALRDPDDGVRAAAVRVLRYRSHSEARKAADALHHDGSLAVRDALSKVLAHFMDREWLKIFVCDERFNFRFSTFMAILPGEFQLRDLLEESGDHGLIGFGKLFAMQRRSVEQRIASLRSGDPIAQLGAAIGLVGVEEALEPLLELADNPLAFTRISAVMALGKISSKSAVDACLKARHDTEPRVRIVAAIALADQKREEALAPLLDIFLHNDNEVDRSQAAVALGSLEAKEALQPLMVAARDPQERVLQSIYSAIGQLASTKEADLLVGYLEGHDQPSQYSDYIFNALWSIAEREARRLPEPDG